MGHTAQFDFCGDGRGGMMVAPVPPAPEVKGWCPGALRPMMSGDGLVVRVRPQSGRLTQRQAAGIAALARAHGNGLVDFSNRANVQIRGVAAAAYDPLIKGLRDLALIDEDAAVEARRNILCSPFWQPGDAADQIARDLAVALRARQAPDVSSKFGYAIDIGPRPVLQDAPADVRLERGADGGLLLCADGMDRGKPVEAGKAVAEMLALAAWFLESGGRELGRMRRLTGRVRPEGHECRRQQASEPPLPGPVEGGFLVALAFGQVSAATLEALATLGALRTTPWRMVVVEGLRAAPAVPGLITDPADPLLRVVACIGAPGCAQALGETRALAAALAKAVPVGAKLHVSGCAKGCAHPRSADLTLTATENSYDLARDAVPGAVPDRAGLTPADIHDILKKAP
jgi:precorrin-3B synthase